MKTLNKLILEHNKTKETKIFYFPFKTTNMNELINAAQQQNKRYSPYNTIKKATEQQIILFAQTQFKGTIEGLHSYNYIWLRQNKRQDPGNIASAEKFIPDAFEKCGILPNDGWNQIGTISHHFAKSPKDALMLIMKPYEKSLTYISFLGEIEI